MQSQTGCWVLGAATLRRSGQRVPVPQPGNACSARFAARCTAFQRQRPPAAMVPCQHHNSPGLKGWSNSTSLRLCPVASATKLPQTDTPPSSRTVDRPSAWVTSCAWSPGGRQQGEAKGVGCLWRGGCGLRCYKCRQRRLLLRLGACTHAALHPLCLPTSVAASRPPASQPVCPPHLAAVKRDALGGYAALQQPPLELGAVNPAIGARQIPVSGARWQAATWVRASRCKQRGSAGVTDAMRLPPRSKHSADGGAMRHQLTNSLSTCD